MSELDTDRQEALSEAREAYRAAFDDYMTLITRWPLPHRKPEQMDEISRAEGRCTIAKMYWDNAKAQRYRI